LPAGAVRTQSRKWRTFILSLTPREPSPPRPRRGAISVKND
jgi:hypothetical protein